MGSIDHCQWGKRVVQQGCVQDCGTNKVSQKGCQRERCEFESTLGSGIRAATWH